ncbi:MAG: UDP-2,3-diacylglucosamine diphosphatase [Alistipes sp.]|nr:UDP-2,3-diacylglucosamine diphosphatase [Alistipes sp.]
MIYFASDTHLGAGTPEEQRLLEQRFVAWLDQIKADAEALYLLGDIFDFWFEYHRVVPQGFVRTLGKLAELTDRGIAIHLFVGNHDMWMGDYLTRACGVQVHLRPEEVTLHGKRLFLAHGDNMRVRRGSLLWLMNTGFRSPILRWLFRWLVHPDLALRFGHWWSGKSRKSHGQIPLTETLVQPLQAYAREYAVEHPGIDYYLFGHMHVAVNGLNNTPRTLHLGSWEQTPTYATLDEQGTLELKTFHL